jgi:glycine cleavage system aminomethyltransferase T
VQFALLDSDRLLYHNEPIWRDGTIVGETTSGMYGHTVDRSLAMGYVSNLEGTVDAAYVDAGTYEIEVAGDRIAAHASLQPFYDPKSLRVRV